ncbi:DUF4214 domain-containing protein [Pseudoduganella sp. UC29_106]|uniref:DUF4214 domain-containing protein n=1 Tax=Pseudoduganella sp. UC29_106 TaxID=3374553 RepID=UPI00375698DD
MQTALFAHGLQNTWFKPPSLHKEYIMAAQDYVAVVQQLYISYFGRPADTFGLKNFTEQLDALKAPTDFVALNAAVQADKAGTGALSKLVNSFNASDEAKALYGTDNSALGITKFLISVFQNVLGREPEAGPGFDFWFDALASGHLRRADAAMAITEGALSNTTPQGLLDAQTVLNKRAVATDFTDSLDTPTKQAAYSTAAAVATASGLLKGVTADTDVTAYHADVVTAVDAVVTSSIPTQNLTLTAGVDTINGGNGNDIINGVIDLTSATGNTFTSLDTIDGKAGNDTLNLNILNGGTTAGDPLTELPGVTVTNVETANIRAAVDITADVSDWSVSTVNVTQGKAVTLTASSTAAVNVSGTTGVVDINGGKSQNISVTGADVTSGTVGAAGDDTAGDVTISVAQVAGHDVIVTGGANVNVTTTGATTGNTINIGQGTQQATGAVKVSVTGGNYSASAASAAMGGITVKGGTSIEVDQVAYASTANAATDTTTVSTRTQGAVSIDGAGTATTVTVNQSKAVTAKDGVAAVAGVKQAATYTFGVLLQGQTMTVAGLTFTAAKDLTAAEVATAFANLAASAAQGEGKVANGSYTGAFAADWTSAAANGATVTFTAKTAATAAASALAPTTAQGTGSATLVQPTAGATVAGLTNVDAVTGVAGIANGQVTIIDSGTVDKIATVNLNGYATGSTIASDALTTLNIANSAGTLAVTNTVQKTLDLTVNGLATGASVTTPTYETINMHVAGASTFGVTATGAKALVVDGSATANISGATGVATTFGNLESVKVNGTAGLNMGATASGSLKSVDTTGTTGTVTVSIDGTKATYTGGAGVDNVTLVASAAITKAVNLGAGDDSLTFTGTNVPTVDGKIDGGAGTNTLVLAAADAATLSLNANFEAAISNFQKLSLGAVVAGATNAVDLANLDDISYVISANAQQLLQWHKLAPQ